MNFKRNTTAEKKTHSLKFLLICNTLKQVVFISHGFCGKTHDFAMFKTLFKAIDFQPVHVHVDLGFLGIKKFLDATEISIPAKASKLHPLTTAQKEQNCILSRKRVLVEHSIAGIKRHFILRNKNRMLKKEKLDHAVEICTMLWNLKTKKLINTQ